MTNDETGMSSARRSLRPFVIRHSSFVIRHSSFVIRHSSFVIRHSSFVIRRPMPRRALRKLDPELDLGFHLKTMDDLPRPWSAEKLFPCQQPLEVEVGSGKGLFLQSAAIAEPEHNFLGIEIATKYARYAAARLAKQQLQNAVMIHGDGQRLLGEFLPDNSLAAVHVYFPDPWWKKR